MHSVSKQLYGLTVRLDKLVLQENTHALPEEAPYAFIYFLTICNNSDRTVTLLGRKWILNHENGETLIVEGNKIVGETPTLQSGESFSYNSYHLTHDNISAHGAFHGIDAQNNPIYVNIPEFKMLIPTDT